jgi:hypothetical protein
MSESNRVIGELQAGMAPFDKLVDDLSAALEQAKVVREQYLAQAKTIISAALNGGFTTDNLLQDDLLRLFGLDGEKIQPFMKFGQYFVGPESEKLMCLVRVPFTTPRVMRASLIPSSRDCFHDDEMNRHNGFILLKLDGGPVRVAENVIITLPGSCHAVMGFNPMTSSGKNVSAAKGPFTFGELFAQPNSHDLWNFIHYVSPGMDLEDTGNQSVAGYSVLVFPTPYSDDEKQRICHRMKIRDDQLDALLAAISAVG